MATAGYSGTPLLKKLGIKPGMKLLVLHPPMDYVALLEQDICDQYVNVNELPDLIHVFSKNREEFSSEMKKILRVCKKNTSVIVWVSWYKKSSGMATDITEDTIRAFALQHGLVDVKVCAVSDVWSGLKLVVPVSKR